MSKNAKTVNNRTREIIEVKSKVCSTKACSVGQRTAALLRGPPPAACYWLRPVLDYSGR